MNMCVDLVYDGETTKTIPAAAFEEGKSRLTGFQKP